MNKRAQLQMLPDEDLLSIYRNEGLNYAFDILYVRHYNYVYGLLYYLTRNKDMSQDLTQDVFFFSLDIIKNPFMSATYFRRFLRKRSYVVFYESRKNRLALSSIDNIDIHIGSGLCVNSVEAKIIKNEEHLRLNSLFGRLHYTNKQILKMHLYKDLTFSEIANLLNVNHNTIKTRYFTSLRLLKKDAI